MVEGVNPMRSPSDALVSATRFQPNPCAEARIAGVATRFEAVPVGGRSARPDLAVDGGRPAEHLAAHPDLELAAGTVRLGRVAVEVAIALQDEVEPLGDVDEGVPIAAAVLQQQHRVVGGPRRAGWPA